MPRSVRETVKQRKSRKPPRPHLGKTPRNSHTSPSKIERQKRIAIALDYRIRALSYPKISKLMGEPVMTVYDLVVDGLKQMVREPAEALREIELERLDLLLSAHFPKAAAGNVERTAVVLRISESKRKLLGMDKPQQLDVTGAVATANMIGAPSDIDRARQLAAFIAMARARKEAGQSDGTDGKDKP